MIDGSGLTIDSNSIVTLEENQTLYAQWGIGKQIGSFYVDFWADTTFTQTVTFATEFATIPKITHTKSCGSFCQNWGHISSIIVSDITTKGFKLTVRGDGDGSQGVTFLFEWTATLE